MAFRSRPSRSVGISRLPATYRQWLRIYRSTPVNIGAIKDGRTGFAGKAVITLKDGKTELTVLARARGGGEGHHFTSFNSTGQLSTTLMDGRAARWTCDTSTRKR
jgi:hypothetical protein